MIYLELFFGFLKVGLFAFGGAYAAIPFIREVVLSYGWLSDEMVSYIVAVSESTPGPIMVNMATYVGSTKGGVLGSLIATFAVVLPAFLVILLIMVVFKKLINNEYFKAILGGLQPAIIGIIAATGVYMLYRAVLLKASGGELSLDLKTAIFAAVSIAVYIAAKKLIKRKISPIIFIVVSAFAGVAVYGV